VHFILRTHTLNEYFSGIIYTYMKKGVALLILCFTAWGLFSQTPCTIQAFASPSQIQCGQEVQLSAFGTGSGNVAFQENFNAGSPQGWQFTQTVTIANNTCGVPSPDGTPFMWMGDASVNPRDMTTVPFDLTLGGTICFEMRYSIQGDASPCEGPDEPQEGVYVQYSVNGGANWTTIQYWNPNGGNDPQLTNWNQYCLAIPPGAQTPNTMIRWHQDNVSGAEYDHWGIDNVIITLNDPNYVITWNHDGYSYGLGSSGGLNPNIVSPASTTTYTVQISDGNNTCTDQVQVVVTNPVIVVSAEPDSTLCPGECLNLDGTAYWQIQPAGPVTFVNDVSQTISAGVGGSAISIPIVTSGLNIGALGPNDILEVCITNMSYFGQNIFPPSLLTVGSFTINLVCPGGNSITLVPSGVTTSTFVLPGYVNTCFTMSAVNQINTAAPPYTNTYLPNQSFANLAGCQANGTWTMSLVPSGLLGVGSGNFGGWSITFDDPGLVGPVTYSWSPTTSMTGESTLTPQVCPSFTTTYTLTATNAPGCLPGSDQVTVTVPNTCCQLQLDNVALTQPSCAGNDGQIVITVSDAIAGLQYSIDNGATFQSSNTFTGLAPGNYNILVNDDNDCPVGQSVQLVNDNAPLIDDIITTNSSCVGNEGSITVNASGGSGGFQYSIDGGATFQASNVFSSLAPGNYTITVEDAAGCETTGQATVSTPGGLAITAVNTTQPSCGQADGSLVIIANGSGMQYSIDGGATYQASATFTGLSSGNYTVSVLDADGCEATQNVVLNDLGAPVINSVQVVNIGCSNTTGSVTVNATGQNLQFSIDGGVTFQTGNVFNGLAAGSYTVSVSQNGCEASETVQITEAPILTANISTLNDGCTAACTGSVNVTVTNGTPPYTYNWAGGIAGNVPQVSSLCGGNYSVNIGDATGCTLPLQASVGTSSSPVADFDFNPSQVVLPDGLVSFTNLSGGADSYSWSFAGLGVSDAANPLFDFSAVGPGIYPICLVASNAEGCSSEHCENLTVKENSFVFVPNAFTPNNNNSNDAFFPVTRDILYGDEFEFSVYSRWGERIFLSRESNMGWDGTYLNKQVPPDVYVWKVTVKAEGQPEQVYLGHVTLLR
jgi:gliding motility-associated-like protein